MKTPDRPYRSPHHHRGPAPRLAARTFITAGDSYADAVLREVATIRAHRRAIREALHRPPPADLTRARPLQDAR